MATPLIGIESITKSFGTRTLLDRVTTGVLENQRIGVVGRNGGGKSTLLAILAGREPVDSGRVTRVNGLQVGALAQADDLPRGIPVRDLVVGDRATHEWAGDSRIRDVVTGLFGGLDRFAAIERDTTGLSGGERRRVALARLLVSEHDLLLLDEPTNHLDVEGVDWLARHLAARRGSLVVVTHDRWFLDAVCDRTWEVDDGQVHEYDGGYSAYVLARAERMRVAGETETKRQNLMRKELAWLRRGAPARTSKPKFRIAAADALIADEPAPRDSVELMKFATTRLGKTVLELEDTTIAAGDNELLRHVTWRLGPGDRVGIVGVNGAGKTTLLRALAQITTPKKGHLVVGSTVRTAFLSQEVAELPDRMKVVEAVEQVRSSMDVGGKEQSASQLLERLGFSRDRQWTAVGDLSGGERRRLQLLRLLMAEPNVLLLDEPTNDLDVETLTGLEDLLDGWPGTLVVVTHDRFFLERVCDSTMALLGDGTLRHLPNGVEEYLERRAVIEAAAVGAATSSGPGNEQARSVDERAARKELSRIERRLKVVDAREAELHRDMSDAAADHQRALVLDGELRALAQEKDELEGRWLTLSDDLG